MEESKEARQGFNLYQELRMQDGTSINRTGSNSPESPMRPRNLGRDMDFAHLEESMQQVQCLLALGDDKENNVPNVPLPPKLRRTQARDIPDAKRSKVSTLAEMKEAADAVPSGDEHKSTERVRAYCLTMYPDDKKDLVQKEADVKALVTSGSSTYAVVGREVCPVTLRNHLQCYITFKNAKTFTAVKRMFPGAHIEKAIATASMNRTYCIKEGDFTEYGMFPRELHLNQAIVNYFANNNVIVIE